jgi:ferric-dicitrate binding protein FerR (iron transport regulator)
MPQPEHISESFIAKYLLGECTPEEVQVLDAWRKENLENETMFESVRSVLEHTAKKHTSAMVDASLAWEKVSEQINTKVVPLRPAYGTWLRAAAAIVILAGIGLLFNLLQTEQIELEAQHEVKATSMPDRSVVTLNKNSLLSYSEHYGEEERRVKLTGEAFFEVEKSSTPFVIEAGNARVKVVGTSFNVKAHPADSMVQVTVESGVVRLYPAHNESAFIELKAGEAGTYKERDQQVIRLDDHIPAYSFWRDQTLKFKRTKMKQVVKVLNEIYEVKIKVNDEAINECLLTATFEDDDIDAVLIVISEIFDLEIEKDGKKYKLKGEGC